MSKILIEIPAPTMYNLVLCTDCTQAAVNDDYTGLDYHYNQQEAEARMAAVKEGLWRLGPGLSPDTSKDDEEISNQPCDCCGTHDAGRRVHFSIYQKVERLSKAEYLRLFRNTNTLVAVLHDMSLAEAIQFYEENKISIQPKYTYKKVMGNNRGLIIYNDKDQEIFRDFFGNDDFFKKGNTLFHVNTIMRDKVNEVMFSSTFINEFRGGNGRD